MPTYDYKCDNEDCGHIEEVLQKGTDPFHFENGCPKCGGVEMTRMVSMPYFAYDNIKTKHSKKVPSWHTDQMKDLKSHIPGNTL